MKRALQAIKHEWEEVKNDQLALFVYALTFSFLIPASGVWLIIIWKIATC